MDESEPSTTQRKKNWGQCLTTTENEDPHMPPPTLISVIDYISVIDQLSVIDDISVIDYISVIDDISVIDYISVIDDISVIFSCNYLFIKKKYLEI